MLAKIHGLKSKYEFEKSKDKFVMPATSEGAIATSPDGSISVYLGDDHKKCILHGKGTSFCISSKSSPQWYYTYRFKHEQIQYFIFDKNQKPPADLVNAGVAPQGKYSEWVDRKNQPNKITGFNSVAEYKNYFNEKFGGNIDSILKPIPITDKEREIKKIIDLIDNNKNLPEEVYQDHDKLLTILHMGYNLKHEDFVKLVRMGAAEIYIMNLDALHNKYEYRYLGRHLDLLLKWVKEQDEIDNMELMNLYMNAEDPIKVAELLKTVDPTLLDIEVDKDVDAFGIINDDNYFKLVQLALWLNKNDAAGNLWSLLFNRSIESVSKKNISEALSWLIENKDSWSEDEILTFITLWSDMVNQMHWWDDSAYDIPAKLIAGREFSLENISQILYTTVNNQKIKDALGPTNLAKMDSGNPYYNWERLQDAIDDIGSP